MDIVERLKELYRFAAEQKGRDWDEQDEIRHLFKLVLNIGYDAADEIERLRKRVELLEGYLNGALELVENFAHCDTTDARKALREKE